MTTAIKPAHSIKFEELASKLKISLESDFAFYSKGQTLESIYDNCEKGEWLCFLFEKIVINHKDKAMYFLRLKANIAKTIIGKCARADDYPYKNIIDAACLYSSGAIDKSEYERILRTNKLSPKHHLSAIAKYVIGSCRPSFFIERVKCYVFTENWSDSRHAFSARMAASLTSACVFRQLVKLHEIENMIN